MLVRKILTVIILVLLAFSASYADDEINSIEQLNDSRCVIGLFDAGPCTDALKLHLPKANLQYFTGPDIYIAVKFGKVDAVAYDNSQMAMAIRDGLEGVKILPGSIGELFNGAGVSRVSKIPGLKEKLNQFLKEAKKDGTISDMLERWVRKKDYKVPDIPEPSNPQFTLTVATTGLVMPFSFYEGNNLTGFDIELARRFALWLGAGLEFKVYGFGGAYAALRGGDADCLLSNLQITEDRKGSVDFSDPIYVTKIVLLVRGKRDTDYSSDEFMPVVWSPSEPENDNSALIREYNGKNIAVGTGSIQAIQIPKILPKSKITYLDTAANLNQALRTGKVDAVATDDAVAYAVERENADFTHADGYLSTYENAFVFPKRMTERQKKIADEMNEYLRRIKSDGTLKQIHDIWFGDDESKKIIADYKNLPATNGTLHIAAENDTQPYTYVKNNTLVGYEVDIITRFCREKGYRPDFMVVNFSGLIPAVQSGKSDVGMCSLTITPERQEAVTFSEPTYKGGTVLLIRKSDYHQSAKTEGTISESQSHSSKTAKTAGTPESHSQSARSARIPKYKHISELDGKPIGMQPGVIDWEEWAAENLPHSKIQYYNTYPDLVSALKTHKIEGFLVDAPVLELMAAEDKALTAINEPVGEPFGYSFCYAKTAKGKKLCDEMSEYIRQIKASGELDALLSAWQGADESAKIPPDFKSLPAKNGTLTFAAEGSYPPFTYYKATKLAGIDLDIAVRFCRAYGYGLKVQTMLFDAMIPAINSGKADFAGDFTPSEEHEEALYYSEPYCNASSVTAVLADTSPVQAVNTPSDYDSLKGKRIGVQIGTTCAELVPERIPSAKVEYYNSLTDQLAALRAGKVEAICCSLPAAIYTENEDPKLTRIEPPLRETFLYPIFADNDKGRKLCEEYSSFLKTLWDNGTIDALNEKWLGSDESKKTVDDYSSLPSTNGKIIMAVDTSLVPFAYVKNNRIVGYDVDLAVMFCKSKGYALEVQNMPLTGVIASVKAGRSDFMQSVNKTPERSENTLFTSTPAIKSGNVLLTVKTAETPGAVPMYTDKSQLAGKKIGAMLGTLNPEIAKQNVPSAEIQQFDSMTDTLVALKAGKVDAICVPVPVARFMMLDNDDIAYCGEQLTHYDLSPIFPKTDAGRKLCAQFTEFIKPLWDDGTIQQLDAKWFSKDDSKKVVDDYSHLPKPNGTLKMAVDLSIVPFVYVMNGKVTGYDVDCAVRFCKAYGYGLEIVPMSFGAIIPALQSGKCDFAMSSFAYTKERAENVLFSYPNAKTGNVFLVMKTHAKETQTVSTAEYTDISQLNGKIIGVTAGSIHDRLAKEKIPDAEIVYFNSNSDILPALLTGKIDAIACGESTALFMMREGHKITYLPQKLQRTNRKAAFAKTERGRKLCKEYSDFLQTLWDNGTIKALVNKWIDSDDDSKRFVEDYSNLPNPNGTLIMAVDPSVPPYLYMKDRRIQGYEIDLAVMFCKAKGYGLNVESMSHNGVLGSLETGKCDFSYGIDFTDEREKSLILSKVPNTDSANVIVVLKHKPSEVHKETSADAAKIESKPSDNEPSFWDDIALSFNKTFIREERWELFLEGIMATMTITISSIFFGMLLGFTAFMFCRTGNAIANIFTKFSVWLIKGTPNVVLLMILYYVIFGNVNISGVIVSIIAFTLTFGTAVYRMLTFGTGAVDRGQTEAAYALGFTDLQTFFRVILPQAALHFMPSLREEVTLLIKSTSVVGYIAVQDLTKMGDIVRSRTYEAFFPLIAVAVIYFILAGMLNIVVTFIEYRITPSRRKPENILRGIDVTGGENHD